MTTKGGTWPQPSTRIMVGEANGVPMFRQLFPALSAALPCRHSTRNSSTSPFLRRLQELGDCQVYSRDDGIDVILGESGRCPAASCCKPLGLQNQTPLGSRVCGNAFAQPRFRSRYYFMQIVLTPSNTRSRSALLSLTSQHNFIQLSSPQVEPQPKVK